MEPLHNDPDMAASSSSKNPKSGAQQQADLELAVMQQELMSSREEKADLRAKVYLLEKEKSGQDLALADRVAVEQTLRTHVQHLQEELGRFERRMGAGRHLMNQVSRKQCHYPILMSHLNHLTSRTVTGRVSSLKG